MEDGQQAGHDKPVKRRGARIAVGGLLLLLVLAGVGVGGYFLGADAADDSVQVRSLEGRLSVQEEARETLQERASELTSEVETLDEEKVALEDRLDSELNLRGASASSGNNESSGAAPAGDARLGEAATVGDYTLKPTAFEQRGSSGDTTSYRATVTVKNNGSESDSPFCGGSGAILLDGDGRSFDGEAVISETSDACEDLQPGLTGTIQLDFKAPPDAEPAALELGPQVLDDEETKVWTLPDA